MFRSTALVLFFALTAPAFAQDALPESVFRDYDHMRQVLDDGMTKREIVTVMRAFGGSDEMTDSELQDLEARVQALFPQPLEPVEVVKSEKLGATWTRELYAYYTGLNYIYALVLFHTRPDAVVAVNFKFNTDPVALLEEF